MPIVLRDGTNYSWANIQLVLFGIPVTGVVSLAYNAKQKKENNYGAGSEPISRGYGNTEYEASIEFYTDTWKDIIASAPGRNPLRIKPFDIQVIFSGEGVLTEKDVLRACEFMENPFTSKQGDTKITVNVPLIIAGIDR